jgi:excisionase family DNA binding protein
MRRLTAPYVRLAAAVLIQAMRDATAARVTTNPDSTMPTPADVASARDFLASPAALTLAAHLGLHPGYVRRLVARLDSAPQTTAAWLTVSEAARRFGYHPERVRWLIRAGHLEAVRAGGGRHWRVNPASLQAYRMRQARLRLGPHQETYRNRR